MLAVLTAPLSVMVISAGLICKKTGEDPTFVKTGLFSVTALASLGATAVVYELRVWYEFVPS
jgi:hypothetical protein